ncbi:MAG: acyltransferase [Nocardioidaceae bacterium]
MAGEPWAGIDDVIGTNLSPRELHAVGFGSVGTDVAVHRSVHVFGAEHIHLGSHVRIDCFCVLTAGPGAVRLGNHIHIGASVHIFGSAGVTLEDFTGLSSRVSVFSTNDDYVEGHLTGPTVPDEFRKVTAAEVVVRKHAVVGAGSVVLPGVTIGSGAAVGALSLVNRDVPELTVVGGVPARAIGVRNGERLAQMEAGLTGAG